MIYQNQISISIDQSEANINIMVTNQDSPWSANHVGNEDHDDHSRQSAANNDWDNVIGSVVAVRGSLEQNHGNNQSESRIESGNRELNKSTNENQGIKQS